MVGARRPWRGRRPRPHRRHRRQLPEGRTGTYFAPSLTEIPLTLLPLSRRDALAGLAATTAFPLISTRAFAAPATEAQANVLLASIGDNLLRLSPTGATA